MRRSVAVAIAVIITAIVSIAGTLALAPSGQKKGKKKGVFESEYNWDEPGKPVLIHGMDAAYPPYTKVTEKGNYEGFDVDVIEKIAEMQGWTVKHKAVAWEGIIPALQKGKIDFIMSGMTINPQRYEKINFTMPYDTYTHQIIIKEGSGITVDDLKKGSKQTVACQLGATSDKWVDRLIDKRGWNISKKAVESYELAFSMIEQGRAKAAVSDSKFTYTALKKDKYKDLKVLTDIGPTYYYGCAVRKDDWDILNHLNQGLENLMGTEQWRQWRKKWEMPV